MVRIRRPELLLEGLGFGEGLRWHDNRLFFSDFLYHHVMSLGTHGDLRMKVDVPHAGLP